MRWRKVFWGGMACWVVGFLWHWWRPSLWLLDLLLIPLAAAVYLYGFGAVVAAIVGGRRWVVALTMVPVLLALTVLVNSAWRIAPQSWFALHRPLFERALETEPGQEYYGNQLPLALRFLTAQGRVSDQQGSRFFPQWLGIPDDAGGYLYNPMRSPEGADLYGMRCKGPIDLGEGWWMCGMAGTGL